MRIKHLFLFGLILLLVSCEKDEINQHQNSKESESYVLQEKITNEQATDVINFLDQTINTENLKLGKINLPFNKNLIDQKTIVKVEDFETGLINYTFGVKRNNEDNFLFQIIITEYGKNQYTEPYIFQYRFDDAFRMKLNEGKARWKDYIWPIYPYTLSATADEQQKNLPCPEIDPSPSSGGSGSPGGSTSSGTTSSGSATSSGSSSDGVGTPDECTYYWTGISDEGYDPNNPEETIVITCPGLEPFTIGFTENDDCPDPPSTPIGIIDPDRIEEIDEIEQFETIGSDQFGVEQGLLLPGSSRGFLIDQVGKMADHLHSINRDMAPVFYATAEGMVSASNDELYALYSAAHDSYSYIKRNYPKDLANAVFAVLLESAKPVLELYLFEIGGPAVLNVIGTRLAQSAAWLKIANTLKLASHNLAASSSLIVFKHAQKYGIDSYYVLKKYFRDAGINLNDQGINVHHLIESRLKNWGVDQSARKSIVLTIEEHRVFTNEWRRRIPYDGATNATITTSTATKEDIKNAARAIYKEYPEILEALGL